MSDGTKENKKFIRDNSKYWCDLIQKNFGNIPPVSSSWDDIDDCLSVLTPFMGLNLNHTMLPDGGGLDMIAIRQYHEGEKIELCPTEKTSYVLKFECIYFEYFKSDPGQSFFLLEAGALPPSGVYNQIRRQSEELVEIEPGRFVERSVWDAGYFGHDSQGDEIPLPSSARLVLRYIGGKFLIVAKSSLWNQTNSTYDGRHNNMSASEIRSQIARALGG